MGSTSAQRAAKKDEDKALLEAAWEARDRSEIEELRALNADLMGQLDLANAAAVRMAAHATRQRHAADLAALRAPPGMGSGLEKLLVARRR